MTELDHEWGSSVAIRGFKNEDDVANKFRDWKEDSDAQEWLEIMGYAPEDIKELEAENLSRNVKSDIKITIKTSEGEYEEGISIKRAKESANYNQVDKRWVKKYEEKWNMPKEAVKALKMFVGRKEHQPDEIDMEKDIDEIKDERRLYFDELPEEKRESLKKFLEENNETIMKDIMKGKEPNETDWILVTQIYDDETRWTLRSIDNAVEELSGEFDTTRAGNIKLGNITLQRKGGDNGRETAQMLQFKMKPFDLVTEK